MDVTSESEQKPKSPDGPKPERRNRTMSEAKHTLLPWQAIENIITESHGIAIAKCFERGYETPNPKANAAFIVRACNAHDPLVAACSELYKAVCDCPDASNYGPTGDERTRVRNALAVTKAALAEANKP